MSFETLGLHDVLLKSIRAAGYTEPTPVQAQSIPAALAGGDLMVSAATGSGKTAAFMLPALHRLTMESPIRSIGPRILVLTPTRELALQVTKAAETYGRAMRRVRVVSVVGGMPYPAQIRLLRQHVDVLVATPGRLLDYIDRGRIDFSRLEMLVLDEADRMLDMGFIEDIEQIAAALPEERQTVMFSATFGGQVGRLAEEMLREPTRIELATHRDTHENIEQRLHFADDDAHKGRLLNHLLRGNDVQQAIIFAATKRDTEFLADRLATDGFAAASLHGDMPQAKRNRTLTALRRGEVRVLVATDVAARGIDVPTISHVINYGMPMRAEDYVHRIGRTGRAGRSGVAITLAGPAERGKVRAIERFTTQNIPVHVIEGLEPHFKPQPRDPNRRFGDRRNGRGFGGEGSRGQGGGQRGGEGRQWGDRPQREGAPARRDDNWGNRGTYGDRGGFGERSNDRGNSFARRDGGNTARPAAGGFGDRPRRESQWSNDRRPSGDRPRFEGRGNDRQGRGGGRFDRG
ncbi:DEAD/DEAH box helicase [Uliginosibacterium sp. sgz301328]|uniref:DEAD/DEAH box helicase n=1 Tax=Uliginosibacterium sp. sgz301328 TaxID=3243764 RepID=UPI00359ECFD3